MSKLIALMTLFLSFTALAQSSHIVLISDSHSLGEFGRVLATKIRGDQNQKFYYFASGGSAPLQWLNGAFTTPCGLVETSEAPVNKRVCQKILTPKLSQIWQAQKVATGAKKVTVIIQGTNLSHKNERRAQEVAWAKKLAEVAAKESDECVWIGPPQMRRSPGFDLSGVEFKVQVIKEALIGSKCHFIDSRELSTYPAKGDGIHYHWPGSNDAGQIQAARSWAEEIYAALSRMSFL